MEYLCSQCHHQFSASKGDEGGAQPPRRCPNCAAEAGLEPVTGVPMPMRMFGLLLAGVIVAAVAGGVVSRIAG